MLIMALHRVVSASRLAHTGVTSRMAHKCVKDMKGPIWPPGVPWTPKADFLEGVGGAEPSTINARGYTGAAAPPLWNTLGCSKVI